MVDPPRKKPPTMLEASLLAPLAGRYGETGLSGRLLQVSDLAGLARGGADGEWLREPGRRGHRPRRGTPPAVGGCGEGARIAEQPRIHLARRSPQVEQSPAPPSPAHAGIAPRCDRPRSAACRRRVGRDRPLPVLPAFVGSTSRGASTWCR